jgi:hypothetical protein
MPSMGARILLVAVTLVSSAGGCTFQQQADGKFGDQHFKTAIALVELYKVRHGSYPESLDSLDYLGDWDKLALASVEYRRLSDGYELDVTRGWVGKPTLSYTAEFWHGLGLKRSNARP